MIRYVIEVYRLSVFVLHLLYSGGKFSGEFLYQ